MTKKQLDASARYLEDKGFLNPEVGIVLGSGLVRELAQPAAQLDHDLVADLGAVGGGVGFIEWLRRPPKRRIRKVARGKRKSSFDVVEGGRSDEPRWLDYRNPDAPLDAYRSSDHDPLVIDLAP